MSADNGIYILETEGPEYRLVHTQNIDQIYGKYNDDTLRWDGDKELIKEVFQESPVLPKIEIALDMAQEMSYDYDYLEDGICVISDFKHLKFSEL